MSARQGEERMPRLKMLGVPWITIQTASYQQTPRKKTNRSVPITSQRTARETSRIFRGSDIEFTNEEADIVKYFKESVESKSPVLIKAPSRLQMLREEQLSKQDFLAVTKTKNPSIALLKTTPHIPRVDSVISFVDSNEFIDEDEQVVDDTHAPPEVVYEGSGPVTVEDLRESVWNYCKDTQTEADGPNLREFRGEIGENNLIRKSKSPGQRKIAKIVSKHSDLEDIREEFHPNKLLEKNEREELTKLRESMKETYSALRYRHYIQQKRLKVPEYLDDVGYLHKSLPKRAALSSLKK